MSDTPSTPKPAPGFFWFLAVFLGFAVLAALFTSGTHTRLNPRDEERAALAAEVRQAQLESLAKMGLETGKSATRLAKGVDALKSLPPAAATTVVVPGSPTQLKQGAAAPAAPAAPAPAAAPN
jgi:hypothetical protein